MMSGYRIEQVSEDTVDFQHNVTEVQTLDLAAVWSAVIKCSFSFRPTHERDLDVEPAGASRNKPNGLIESSQLRVYPSLHWLLISSTIDLKVLLLVF